MAFRACYADGFTLLLYNLTLYKQMESQSEGYGANRTSRHLASVAKFHLDGQVIL
jgi:hypothetical protein